MSRYLVTDGWFRLIVLAYSASDAIDYASRNDLSGLDSATLTARRIP